VYAEALDRQSDEIRVRANEGTRPEAFISGTLPRDQCTEGYLPLGGELTLVVPSPTAEVAAKLE
jgi:hypothetical protein